MSTTKTRKRTHRDWKSRFYWTAGAMLSVNVILLFLLAVSYLRPLQAFESTKIDAQVLAELLSSQAKGQNAEKWLATYRPKSEFKWEFNQTSLGGINFYRDEQGNLVHIEHWSKPKR